MKSSPGTRFRVFWPPPASSACAIKQALPSTSAHLSIPPACPINRYTPNPAHHFQKLSLGGSALGGVHQNCPPCALPLAASQLTCPRLHTCPFNRYTATPTDRLRKLSLRGSVFDWMDHNPPHCPFAHPHFPVPQSS